MIALGVTTTGEKRSSDSCRPRRRIGARSRVFSPTSGNVASRSKARCSWSSTGAKADAKRALLRLVGELQPENQSAARSSEEGLEENLTLHGLDVFPELGVSFKTPNLIESVMARAEDGTAKVDRWRTSD